MLNLLALLLLAGCPKDPETDTDVDTDTDTDTDSDSDTDPDTSAWPDTFAGVVMVSYWPSDHFYDASVQLHAVFSSDEGWAAAVDPVGLLQVNHYDEVEFLSHDWWPLPAVGENESVSTLTLPFDPDGAETLDVGDRLFLGPDWEAYRTDAGGLTVYVSDREDAPPVGTFATGGTLDLEFLGGADADAIAGLGAIDIPTALDLPAALDPTVLHVETGTEDLAVTWTPSGTAGASVLVAVIGDPGVRIYRADEADGALTIPSAAIQELGGDAYIATIARLFETSVATPIGVVTVRAMAETWTYHTEAVELGIAPDTVLTGELTHLALFDPTGSFDETLSFDGGDGILVDDIVVGPGGTSATVRILVDEDAESGPRPVFATTSAGTLESDVDLFVRHPLPPADTCDGALVGPALRDGFSFSDGTGYSNTWEGDGDLCATDTYEGREAWMRVTLDEGELLSVSALSEYGDVAVALFADCAEGPVECFDDNGPFGVEILEYVAPEAGTYVVVVDNVADLSSDGVYLYTERRLPDDLAVFPSQVPRGQSYALAVDSTVGAFVAGDVFSFGPGITVQDAVLDGTTATVSVDVAANADNGPRTVTVTRGADVFAETEEALIVLEELPASDDCAAADALGPLAPGAYHGSTVGLTSLDIDTTSCLTYPLVGADAVYRIDVANVGDTITVSSGSDDIDHALYLVRSCAPDAIPVSCADTVDFEQIEHISWIAQPGDTGTWYLVVDVVDTEVGTFDLILEEP